LELRILLSRGHYAPGPQCDVAGVLGFAVGKVSYIGQCLKKFQKTGGVTFGPQKKRHCPHTWKECEAKLRSNEKEGSIPSAF
ncbi:PREDICTED: OCIA domain-containing protein 2, partial [Tauraco erythrolophus]|uniref:OCIA domain-containing protein 2 n=1 Tax=Tauraco erythrolophus TaxID=121530 RepID=UPI0005238D6F